MPKSCIAIGDNALRRDLVRMFVQYAQAHVLEHRQAVRQRDGLAQVHELEAQRSGRRFERPVQAHGERLGLRESRHQRNVGNRVARRKLLAVPGRKGVGKLAIALDALRLAELLDERNLQVVGPAPCGADESRLQRPHVELRNGARRRAHDDVNPRQHRFGQAHVEFGARAVECLHQDRLPLLAQVRGVVFAWRVDDARQEALEGIPADEQAKALAVVQVQDADRRAQQLVVAGLEELVARIGGEDVQERLAGMAAEGQARARHDIGDLAAQQRDIGGICAVRRRREETQEAILADDVAGIVEALDRNVVEIARTMHGRSRRRFGDHEQLRAPRISADFRRQRGEARRDILATDLAQDAETRAGNDAQCVLPVHGDEIVASITQEREVIVGEPAHELAAFLDLGNWDWRRTLLDVRDDRERRVLHRLPVADGEPHVGEHTGNVGGKFVQRRAANDAVDFDMNERLAASVRRTRRGDARERAVGGACHVDERMDDEMLREPVPVHFHRHRVDEERHVVVDDLDDRMRRLPAAFLKRRIECPHPRVACLALAREVPVRECSAVEIGQLPLGEILRVDLAVVHAHERLERFVLCWRLGPHECSQFVDTFRTPVLLSRAGFHGDSPRGSSVGRASGPARRGRDFAHKGFIGMALLCRDSVTWGLQAPVDALPPARANA